MSYVSSVWQFPSFQGLSSSLLSTLNFGHKVIKLNLTESDLQINQTIICREQDQNGFYPILKNGNFKNDCIILINNGETLNFFQHGIENINKNPTLLFIHGHFGCWKWWAQTLEVFKNYDYHIIAVDMRGFGDSSYINQCSYFKDWAGDLVDLCKIKKVEACVAIGWSFGGGISMKFAQMAPDLVKKVILTCSISSNGYIAKTTEGTPCKTMEQIKSHPFITWMEEGISQSNREAVKASIYLTLLLTKNQHHLIQKCQDMLDGTMKQRCYYDVWFAMANGDIDINAVKAKGLFLHGKEDPIIQYDDIQSTGNFFKSFEVWEENAHMIPIESVQRYADKIRKFIEQ